jgi:cytochrome b6-f complex iron-sulfur subunit
VTIKSENHPESRHATQEKLSRRRMLNWLWGALGVIAGGELIWIATSFLRPKRGASGPPPIFVAGPATDFEPGTVTAFPAGKFYLVRLDDGGFLALDRECTHLGCTVPWSERDRRFACPCHASSFDISGQVLSPPAPRPLDYYSVRIENGIVKIDTRRRQQRSEFHPSQVARS